MTNKISMGVLGCANIAQRSVIPAIKHLTDFFELKAVASRAPEKALACAREFDCEAIVGYDNLIKRKDIEALYIPLPTGLHKEWINKSLKAGKSVYAEKSIAINHTDAQEMVHNAKLKNMALMEGFMFQYHNQHQIVLDLLNNGAIGEIRHFCCKFGFPPLEKNNFRYDNALGGGALMDAAGYTVRATHFILGNEFKVKAATLFTDDTVATNIYGSAYMSNNRGVGASLAFGFDNYYQCNYEIWGQKGEIFVEKAFTPRPDYSPKIILTNTEGVKTIEAEPENHFEKAFVEFYQIIRDRELRANHFEQILLQSSSLETIRNLSLQ